MNLNETQRQKLEAHVRDFLAKRIILKDYDLFFFGSRVDGTSTANSDVDLGIYGKKEEALPPGVLADLNEHLQEIPLFLVCQAVDFAQVSKEFKATALKHKEPFSG